MSARVATPAEQMPRRARYLVPKGLPRRGEILAACVVVAVLAHVLFAQLTLVLAVLFVLITRATRWRLSWLIVPVVVGVAWTLAVGPRVAAAGFADGPAKVAGYLGASGHQLDHALHFTAAFSRERELAAAPAPAGHPGRRRRGGHHRLAELAAYRRGERAAGPPRPAGRPPGAPPPGGRSGPAAS